MTNIKYGTVLKFKRETMGLTQSQFAERAHVTGSTICAIENNKEVSELVLSSVKQAMRILEDEMVANQYDDYKLMFAAKLATYEVDPDEKIRRLHNLLFSVTKELNNLDKSKFAK